MKLGTRERMFAYALLLPAVLFVLSLIAYPLISTVQLSLVEGRYATVHQTEGRPLGGGQYVDVLTDPATWESLARSAVYVFGVVGPAFGLGLGLALVLRRAFRGRRWMRTLALIPWAVPGVIASAVFLWMLDQSFGVINKLLLAVGLIPEAIPWYSNPDTAMVGVLIPTVWKAYPFFVIVLLAALQTVPEELYEAARIDGANALQQFRHVTWPGIRGAAYIAIIISGLGAFREFDFIYPLTQGGPQNATSTLAIRIYQEAFHYSNMGYAAATGVVAIVIATIAVLLVGRRAVLKG